MAVYTHISDTEVRACLRDYDIGALASLKGIAEGVENSNYILRTDTGMFILTLFEKRVDARDVPFFLNLMLALADAGCRVPRPQRRRDGALFGKLAGRTMAIIAFIEGVAADAPTETECHAAGGALAQMHAAAAKIPGPDNRLGISAWEALLKDGLKTGEHGEMLQSEIAFLRERWPSEIPQGIIHGDLFPDNVLFHHDVPGMIDFTFACRDALAYELAICFNAWGFREGFTSDNKHAAKNWRAFLKGYEKTRPLEPKERAAFPVLCRGAAVRFLLTRLHDRLNPADERALVRHKDPEEYIARLKFHQEAHKANNTEIYGV